MKVKLNLYISNPEAFIRGDRDLCFAISSGRHMDDEWVFCTDFECAFDVDDDLILDSATSELDSDIGKHTAAITILEQRKAELLALPAPENDDE